ncbi:YwqJ-related putative deaminase [Saccharophagus degradans]|uniref:YwqJ-related putative deaminase n=2 Tax=Saccharophagus degradans TaxID=86304 RepID=A0AAW7X877_9GAMM|nr:YwqJ-related putative deaminase [Saccharophagus degradans]MDO6607998.1 YwqJ-related putative deaminase [Saccharophagus degradans]
MAAQLFSRKRNYSAMMVSHPLPIPLPFTSELYGVRLFSGCWLFAKQTFQPSYWMMLKREGFSGDLVGNSSELSLVLGMLGAEHLRAIYTLYHGSPPTHFFDFSLRGDIEHLILSGRIKAFYLSEDKTERLGNPQDVLYANPDSIDLNCESPVVAQRYRLAEELATDVMARWTQKDAEDLAHWDRFVLWRKGYEAYDITAEAFDTVYDFIVGLKDIAVFVVEISYEAAKTQLKVNRALLEMTYKGATGDIEGLRADLAKVGVMVDEKIDSAQKLITQAEQGKKIFDALVNDPLTRNLIFDFLDSLYQSISYRESRTFKARIVFEIGIEVLLALATAGIGNVARRTAQTARATTNAIKATKTAQRIGPFTKHALDLMADLAKVMNKPIHVEEIPPVKGLELPDFGKLSKSELGGVGDSKATVNAPESTPSTSSVREGGGVPNGLTSGLTDDAASIISSSTKGQLRKQAALSRAGVDELDIVSKNYANLPGSAKNFPGVRRLDDQFFVIDDQAAYIRQVEKLYADSGNTLNSVTRSRILEHIGDSTRQFPTQAGIPGLHAEVQSVNNVINQVPAGFDLSRINVSTIKLAPGPGQGMPFPACSNCGGILSNTVNILTGVK